jgi:hypothetical protein
VAAVLGEVAPYALALVLSPFRVTVAILLLFTARPRATAGAFLSGWAIGIAVTTGAFVALAAVVERSEEPPAWASWARIALGVVMLLVGAQLWLRRDGEADPAWLRSLERTTPARASRLGLLLSVNPKTVLLTAAGGLAIGAAELVVAGTVAAVAVFTGLAVLPVALPLLLHTLLGARTLAVLDRARSWLSTHNVPVMAAAFTGVGVLLTVQGAAEL